MLLIIPGGLRVNDEAGLLRCFTIRRRPGLTEITYCEGQEYAVRDFGYRGAPRPIGSYHLKPESEEEQKRHAAQTAAAQYAEQLPQQEQAPAAVKPAKHRQIVPLNPAAKREETLEERTRRLAGYG